MKGIRHLMQDGQLSEYLIAVQIARDELAGWARDYFTGLRADFITNFEA